MLWPDDGMGAPRGFGEPTRIHDKAMNFQWSAVEPRPNPQRVLKGRIRLYLHLFDERNVAFHPITEKFLIVVLG
jgi:hypothetical protein